MNRSALRLLAMVLPLAGLGGTWIWTHVRAQQGTEWDVPVTGYDPRDLLRGHYIVYRYAWPGLDERKVDIYSAELCLIGTAPRIERTVAIAEAPGGCRNPVRAAEVGADMLRNSGLAGGILYVPQTQARPLERKLADPRYQGVVRIRVRDDGHVTPLRITFRRK